MLCLLYLITLRPCLSSLGPSAAVLVRTRHLIFSLPSPFSLLLPRLLIPPTSPLETRDSKASSRQSPVVRHLGSAVAQTEAEAEGEG